MILRRAYRKLTLKYQVLDKGDFSVGSKSIGSVIEDEEELEAESLAGMIKFGLQELIIDDNSTIVDDDIETILSRAKVSVISLCLPPLSGLTYLYKGRWCQGRDCRGPKRR